MPFLWLGVRDRQLRGIVERNTIALLSERTGGIDRPSDGWLGLHADNEKVRTSGLWNVNHVDESYDPEFLDALVVLVAEATVTGS